MKTKICTRCKEEKDLSRFDEDKRRDGSSRYQQPCKDCRNLYNRAKRRINIANNKLEYAEIKHIPGFKEFSEDAKKFAEARLLLVKAINNYTPVFVQGSGLGLSIGCTKCKHVTPLPDIIPGKQLAEIIAAYEKHHKSCS